MELAVRKGDDRFVPPGDYRGLEAQLRADAVLGEIPAVVLAAFDRRTRLLPFLFYDARMFPSGTLTVAGALSRAGFRQTRAVFQLWNPNFRPSRARIDGRPPQMLLISSMQIHARQAYAAIRDACGMGEDRPLIVAGGPKAIYEPYHFWSIPGTDPRVAPDVVVTGEAYVLLDLLNVLRQFRGRGGTMRAAFERARHEGALNAVPGLVYLAPGATIDEPAVVDTGLQRLVQDLDELPHEAIGLSLLEPPGWGAGLARLPIPVARVHRHVLIASILMTQGCKFHCPYCPIPAAQQQSWRSRSPEVLVEVIRTIFERFGIRYFFGVDDNFFNRRDTAAGILTAMARAMAWGRPFAERVRFVTEATQFDTYRNRDLLSLARSAGMHSIWFGIEDLTASLINKGQQPAMTLELFRLMHEHRISPMGMLMFHAGQPFFTPRSQYGLFNQIAFLRRAGAISVQVFVHTPAVGTREYEAAYRGGTVIERIGRYRLPESSFDGSHVVVVDDGDAPWKRQLKLLAGYATFYNPWSLLQAIRRDGSRLRRRRTGFQVGGLIATLWTAVKCAPYVLRLMLGRVQCHRSPPALYTVPMRMSPGAFPRYPLSPANPNEAQPSLVAEKSPEPTLTGQNGRA